MNKLALLATSALLLAAGAPNSIAGEGSDASYEHKMERHREWEAEQRHRAAVAKASEEAKAQRATAAEKRQYADQKQRELDEAQAAVQGAKAELARLQAEDDRKIRDREVAEQVLDNAVEANRKASAQRAAESTKSSAPQDVKDVAETVAVADEAVQDHQAVVNATDLALEAIEAPERKAAIERQKDVVVNAQAREVRVAIEVAAAIDQATASEREAGVKEQAAQSAAKTPRGGNRDHDGGRHGDGSNEPSTHFTDSNGNAFDGGSTSKVDPTDYGKIV